MKIRLTILTENDVPRRPEHTEALVTKGWQEVLDMICLLSDNADKAVVEKVEFVEG